MSHSTIGTGAAVLAAIAGTAIAQPAIDGTLVGDEAVYGSALWVQTTPTAFGDNTAQTVGDPGADPGAVDTGLELVIPLSEIGLLANGPISLGGFINGSGHDFASNQFIGGLSGTTENLGEPRTIDLDAEPGQQFIAFTATELGAMDAAPIVDGTLDAIYGAPLAGWTQNNITGFGNADHGNQFGGGGSEINAVYGVVKDGNLHLFIAGNVEANFNKLELFFDTIAGGQNQLRGDNPDVDFDGLNRMGALLEIDENDIDCIIDPTSPDCDRIPDPNNPGLKFDAGFEPDFWITYTGGNDPYEAFYSYAELLTAGGGSGGFLGGNSGMGGALTGGAITSGIFGAIDNSNTAGIGGSVFTTPDANIAFGSEANAIYGHIDETGNTLYLLITGNLNTNGDSLDLFIDADAGSGQNSLRLNNPQIGAGGDDPAGDNLGGLNRMGEAFVTIPDPNDPDCIIDPESPDCGTIDQVFPGLTFDSAVSPNYYLSINQTISGGTVNMFAEAAVLRTNGKLIFNDSNFNDAVIDYGAFDGISKPAESVITFDGPNIDQPPVGDFFANVFTNFAPQNLADQFIAAGDVTITPVGTPNLIRIAVDNSNVAGVTDTDVSGASAVQTGIEVALDLDEIGWDGGDIRVAGFFNAGDQNFVSNQVIGSLPDDMGLPADNLGEPRVVDFGSIAGDQFVTITVGGGPVCLPDITTDGTSNGIPDGLVTLSDFSFYLGLWSSSDLAADIATAGTDTGIPDGVVTLSDFSFYLGLWSAGCP